MLWRYFSRALLAAGLLAPTAALAVPVDLTNPAFRPVRWYQDLTNGRAIAQVPGLAGPNVAPGGHELDVDELALHGLTHPGTSDAVTLRSGASVTNDTIPSPVITVGPDNDFLEDAPVGSLAVPPYAGYPTDMNPGDPNATCINPPGPHCAGAPAPYGMVEVPGSTAFAFAFGGSAPGPDVLDGVIFNFLIPGAVFEGGTNADNDPFDTDPNIPPEGLDGLVALPGTYSSELWTISLTSTDPYGARPVVSGTLTGALVSTGLGSAPLFDGVAPTPDDPNIPNGTPVGGTAGPLPFGFYDTTTHLDPNSVPLGSTTIGLNSRIGPFASAVDPSYMIDPRGGGAGITLSAVVSLACDTTTGAGNSAGVIVVSPLGVCQFSPEHGYMSALAGPAAAQPLTAVAASLGLPGAWGITTDASAGGIPIGPGLYANNIGVFNAVGGIDVAGVITVTGGNFGDVGFAEIPEPSTLLLMGLGVAGLALVRRRTSA